ncbi:unnamed protein product [Rangifer tarandus platyrhynchus]|uniref:Uncharacterized protein n=2 Tax=Rangifer tarandus platyrhynchus TaxID=3082113 RepID=A0ACB0FMQ9_RANTA|nr:unnamed protein product [Rangifer tarandus platyrhynchus]CAI9713489.1 unnamed protein product [Rangifer tarandus platyrhynchus]
MAGGGGVVCVGCAPGPRLAAGDNPKGSHFGTHNGNTWISSFQWIDFREQAPPLTSPSPFHSIVGLSALHSHRRPAGGGVRAWISPASPGQGQARSRAGGWTRGLQAASGRAAATPRWVALGGEAAAASALTWGDVGRRLSRWGSSSHLLASVSSDEIRYVNRFAAGKWRAGRRDPRGLRLRRRSGGGAGRSG